VSGLLLSQILFLAKGGLNLSKYSLQNYELSLQVFEVGQIAQLSQPSPEQFMPFFFFYQYKLENHFLAPVQ
jgi:hypothetical protein